MKPLGKVILGSAIALALVLVVTMSRMRGESSKEVDIAVAAEQAVRPTILASGVLAYLNEVNLTSELVAKVREIKVQEGDRVESGPLIERRMIGQSEFDDLRNARDLARVELQGSEEALRRAEAVLGEARDLLGKTDIRAPITGTIVALPIKVGETAIASTNAFAGAALMTIADTSAIQAELKVDEADIARIAVGQAVDVYATAFPDTALKGKVQRIALAPTLENQARTYEVVVLIAPPDGLALRSGMSVRADIFLGDGEPRLAVPVEAVGTDEDEEKKVERFVWVDRDGLAERRVVTVGVSDDRWEEIVSGLQAGDRVITGPGKELRLLAAGDRVRERVRDADSDDAAAAARVDEDEDEDADDGEAGAE
jgi:HlyD family secretion protein